MDYALSSISKMAWSCKHSMNCGFMSYSLQSLLKVNWSNKPLKSFSIFCYEIFECNNETSNCVKYGLGLDYEEWKALHCLYLSSTAIL